jgi:membrane protease subunit HflK
MTFLQSSTLNPEKVGYVLTGDGNVVHVSFGLNYQISDPVLFATQIEEVEKGLDHLVRSVALSSMASRTVDTILSDGREALVKEISQTVQNRLDTLSLGVRVVSLEIQDLVPPYQVKDEFNAVQTASIEAKTKQQEAEEYRAQQIPRAETTYKKEVSRAKSGRSTALAKARAESQIFEQLVLEAQRNPIVVRRRLLQEKLEQIGENAGKVRFVPPPVGARYPEGFRIVLDGEP